MSELLNHLTNDHFGSYFWNETTQLTEYGNLIAYVHVTLKRALNEGADRIEVTAGTLMWSRAGKVIHKIDLDQANLPDDGTNFAAQMRKILAKDPIVQKWTRVVSDTNTRVICEFLS